MTKSTYRLSLLKALKTLNKIIYKEIGTYRFRIMSENHHIHFVLSARITSGEDIPEDVFRGYTCFVVCEKKGTSEQHYHAVVYGVKAETLRSRFKKYYKGNKQFSIKHIEKWTEERRAMAIRYCTKGTINTMPIVVKNTVDVNVKDCYERFWKERREYEESLKDKEGKKKVNLREKLLASIQKQYDSGIIDMSMTRFVQTLMVICQQHDKIFPGDFQCLGLYEYVHMNLKDKEGKHPHFVFIRDQKCQRLQDKLQPRTYNF